MKTAEKTLHGLKFTPETHPAICALVEFAAQPAGLEFGNYGDRVSFNEEKGNILKDWHRFKDALRTASAEDVSDANVIAESPHAFSGRLSWVAGEWVYCTGQYFPTEYRKAAATLLEYATRAVRRNRPAKEQMPETIEELKALNEANGGCYFEASTMLFFHCEIESEILNGCYFITSERQNEDDPKAYSVRKFDARGNVSNQSKFCEFDNLADALAAVPQ